MAASITFYESFREYIADGTFDMNSNTFVCTLHTSAYTPNASTHTVSANLTNEVANANGYTTRAAPRSRLSCGLAPGDHR